MEIISGNGFRFNGLDGMSEIEEGLFWHFKKENEYKKVSHSFIHL